MCEPHIGEIYEANGHDNEQAFLEFLIIFIAADRETGDQ